jgi:hypothetical protein
VHTPGPWRIEIFSRHGDLSSKTIIGSDGQGFASTCGLSDPLDTANANLIASAPELLAALKLWEHWYNVDSTEELRDTARQMGLDAIAKAESKKLVTTTTD